MLETLAADAADQLKRTGTIDPAALARKVDMDAFGLQPTSGQVTRDPTQWARERNLAKLDLGDTAGNPLEARFTEQNARLQAVAREMAQATGPAEEVASAGARAQRVAMMRSRLTQRAVGRQYGAARATVDADAPIPTDGLAARVAPILDDFENALPADVTRRIRQVLDVEDPRTFSPRESEKLLQLINKHWDPKSPPVVAGLGALKQAVTDTLDEYGEATGGLAAEAFATARQAAAERFKALRPKPVQKLLDPTYAPDRFIEQSLVGGSRRDVADVVKFFSAGPDRYRKVGGQVLDGLRRQVDEWLYRQATGKAGETFSGANYSAALERFGRGKLETLYGTEDAARRQQFARAARATTTVPAGSAVNYSNTAATLTNYLARVGSKASVLSGPADVLRGLAQAGRAYAEEQAQRRLAYEALTGQYRTPAMAAEREAAERALLLGTGRRPGLLMLPAAPAGGLLMEANQ
jgi:hypothetical protein